MGWRRGRREVVAEAGAVAGHVGGVGATGRHAAAAGREGSRVQVRAERFGVAVAAGDGSECPVGRQGKREPQAGSVPGGGRGNPRAHHRAARPDAELCAEDRGRDGPSARGADDAGRRIFQDSQRQNDGSDAGQGAPDDDLPVVCSAGAECVAVLLQPPQRRDLDAGLPAVSAGGGIPDVEGSRRRRLGDHHAGAGHREASTASGWTDPRGMRESFDPFTVVGDPYGRAATHARRVDDRRRSGGDEPVVQGLDGPGLDYARSAGCGDLRMPRARHDGAPLVGGAGGEAGQICRNHGDEGQGNGAGPSEEAGREHGRAAADQRIFGEHGPLQLGLCNGLLLRAGIQLCAGAREGVGLLRVQATGERPAQPGVRRGAGCGLQPCGRTQHLRDDRQEVLSSG